jgi:hypothetical protein
MKKKSEELDVDFIGSQDKLTKEEELALSNYFSKRRAEGRANSTWNCDKILFSFLFFDSCKFLIGT